MYLYTVMHIQKILWSEVRKQTGRGKNRFKIRDLFADERCSQAILDFQSATDVRRTAGSESAGDDVISEASELEYQGQEDESEERDGIGSGLGA